MQERYLPTPPDGSDLSTPHDEHYHGQTPKSFFEEQPEVPNFEVPQRPLTLESMIAQASTLGAIKAELRRWIEADAESELGQLLKKTWPAEKSVVEVLQNLERAERSLPASFDDAHPTFLTALGSVSRVFKLRDQVRVHFLEISYALALLDQATPTLAQIFTGLKILDGQGYVFLVKRAAEVHPRYPADVIEAVSAASEATHGTELLTLRLRRIRFWVDKITAKYNLDLKVYYILTKNWPVARKKYRLPRRLALDNRYQNYFESVSSELLDSEGTNPD